jgi:hypothetical protein
MRVPVAPRVGHERHASGSLGVPGAPANHAKWRAPHVAVVLHGDDLMETITVLSKGLHRYAA